MAKKRLKKATAHITASAGLFWYSLEWDWSRWSKVTNEPNALTSRPYKTELGAITAAEEFAEINGLRLNWE